MPRGLVNAGGQGISVFERANIQASIVASAISSTLKTNSLGKLASPSARLNRGAGLGTVRGAITAFMN